MVGKRVGGQLRSEDAREDSWIHLVLIRQSGKQMTAVSKGESGEQGGEAGWSAGLLGGYAVWCAPSASHLPAFSSHHCTAPFLPSQADLSNSLMPKERMNERRWQQRRECFPLSSSPSSSFLRISLIPRWVPSFITAYHLCIILYRTLPINIIRAARST